MLYSPEDNTLHIGPLGYAHGTLMNAAWDRGFNFKPTYQGWLGENPEAERHDPGVRGEWGWYSDSPGPHIDVALSGHYNALQRPADEWNFGPDEEGGAAQRKSGQRPSSWRLAEVEGGPGEVNANDPQQESNTPQHVVSLQPGELGKALYMADGTVHAWPLSEAHSHGQYIYQNNLGRYDARGFYDVTPDGRVLGLTNDPHANEVAQAIGLGEQETAPSWSFTADELPMSYPFGPDANIPSANDVRPVIVLPDGTRYEGEIGEYHPRLVKRLNIDPGLANAARHGVIHPHGREEWYDEPHWNFNAAYGDADQLNWQPGTRGKGLMDANGNLHTWTTSDSLDGFPSHADYLVENGLPHSLKDAVYIERDGRLHYTPSFPDAWEAVGHQVNPREWDFRTAAVPEIIEHTPVDMQEAGKETLSNPEGNWDLGGYEQRQPLLYVPNTNQIHIGPYDYAHGDVMDVARAKGYPYMGENLAQGWVGDNPESMNSEDIHEPMVGREYGWYSFRAQPPPEVHQALDTYFRGAQHQPQQWNFTAALDPSKVQQAEQLATQLGHQLGPWTAYNVGGEAQCVKCLNRVGIMPNGQLGGRIGKGEPCIPRVPGGEGYNTPNEIDPNEWSLPQSDWTNGLIRGRGVGPQYGSVIREHDTGSALDSEARPYVVDPSGVIHVGSPGAAHQDVLNKVFESQERQDTREWPMGIIHPEKDRVIPLYGPRDEESAQALAEHFNTHVVPPRTWDFDTAYDRAAEQRTAAEPICPHCGLPIEPTQSQAGWDHMMWHENCLEAIGVEKAHAQAFGINNEDGWYWPGPMDQQEWEEDYPLPEDTRRQLGPIRQGRLSADFRSTSRESRQNDALIPEPRSRQVAPSGPPTPPRQASSPHAEATEAVKELRDFLSRISTEASNQDEQSKATTAGGIAERPQEASGGDGPDNPVWDLDRDLAGLRTAEDGSAVRAEATTQTTDVTAQRHSSVWVKDGHGAAVYPETRPSKKEFIGSISTEEGTDFSAGVRGGSSIKFGMEPPSVPPQGVIPVEEIHGPPGPQQYGRDMVYDSAANKLFVGGNESTHHYNIYDAIGGRNDGAAEGFISNNGNYIWYDEPPEHRRAALHQAIVNHVGYDIQPHAKNQWNFSGSHKQGAPSPDLPRILDYSVRPEDSIMRGDVPEANELTPWSYIYNPPTNTIYAGDRHTHHADIYNRLTNENTPFSYSGGEGHWFPDDGSINHFGNEAHVPLIQQAFNEWSGKNAEPLSGWSFSASEDSPYTGFPHGWVEGQHGKGMLYNGQMYSWPVNGSRWQWSGPHHVQMAERIPGFDSNQFWDDLREKRDQPDRPALYAIDPDGRIFDTLSGNAVHPTVFEQDPRLHETRSDQWNFQAAWPGWNFGPTTPMNPTETDEAQQMGQAVINAVQSLQRRGLEVPPELQQAYQIATQRNWKQSAVIEIPHTGWNQDMTSERPFIGHQNGNVYVGDWGDYHNDIRQHPSYEYSGDMDRVEGTINRDGDLHWYVGHDPEVEQQLRQHYGLRGENHVNSWGFEAAFDPTIVSFCPTCHARTDSWGHCINNQCPSYGEKVSIQHADPQDFTLPDDQPGTLYPPSNWKSGGNDPERQHESGNRPGSSAEFSAEAWNLLTTDQPVEKIAQEPNGSHEEEGAIGNHGAQDNMPVPPDPDHYYGGIKLKDGTFIMFDSEVYTHPQYMASRGIDTSEVAALYGWSPEKNRWVDYSELSFDFAAKTASLPRTFVYDTVNGMPRYMDRRPVVYYPDSDELHVGGRGDAHHNVYEAHDPEYEHDEPTWNGYIAYPGEDRGMIKFPVGFGWYDNNDPTHDARITEALRQNVPDFDQVETHAPDTWSFTATQVVELPGEATNTFERPFLYNAAQNTVHVGPPGEAHSIMIANHGLDPTSYRGLVSPDYGEHEWYGDPPDNEQEVAQSLADHFGYTPYKYEGPEWHFEMGK